MTSGMALISAFCTNYRWHRGRHLAGNGLAVGVQERCGLEGLLMAFDEAASDNWRRSCLKLC
jgi:hypothetical protein